MKSKTKKSETSNLSLNQGTHKKNIYQKKKGNHEDSQFPCVDLTGKQIES